MVHIFKIVARLQIYEAIIRWIPPIISEISKTLKKTYLDNHSFPSKTKKVISSQFPHSFRSIGRHVHFFSSCAINRFAKDCPISLRSILSCSGLCSPAPVGNDYFYGQIIKLQARATHARPATTNGTSIRYARRVCKTFPFVGWRRSYTVRWDNNNINTVVHSGSGGVETWDFFNCYCDVFGVIIFKFWMIIRWANIFFFNSSTPIGITSYSITITSSRYFSKNFSRHSSKDYFRISSSSFSRNVFTNFSRNFSKNPSKRKFSSNSSKNSSQNFFRNCYRNRSMIFFSGHAK